MKHRSFAFAVMAKAPQVGRVKTRLTPPLTADQAMLLGAGFIADTVDVVREAARSGIKRNIAPFIAYMPAGCEKQMRAMVGLEVGLVLADGAVVDEPGVSGLGCSLLHAMRSLLEAGHDGVCLISADAPTLPPELLVEAAEHLARPGDRLVLGPAEDGGYYLIGLSVAHKELFRDIAWSTGRVAAATVARAGEIGLECVMLPSWYDIDDQSSLGRLISALESGSETAPRSAATLREFGLLT
ncbi:MAG TPA: TIGR04282 family arsenosugar biosynthesis glycosyltransferase [Acidiphilium sp.]|nr:TIGR04282 family arsenosugar biosynthesis glycosyltransferase [Acidiphilium sp.]